MPGASDIRAGGAYVKISGDETDLEKSLNRAASKLQRFGSTVASMGLNLAGIGTAISAPLAIAAKIFGDEGAALALGARQTGVAVEQLSTLKYAAQSAGVQFEALEKVFGKMNKTMGEGSINSASATEALSELGLTMRDLQGISPDEQFKKIADRIASLKDVGQQSAAAMKIFGKNFQDILPLLQMGGTRMSEVQRQSEMLGLQWKTEDAVSGLKFAQTLQTVQDVMQHIAAVIGGMAAPSFERFSGLLILGTAAGERFVEEQKKIVQFAVPIGGAILGSAVALGALGTAFDKIGSSLRTFSTIIGLVAAPLPILTSALGLLLTPAAAVVVIFGGATAAFLAFTQSGRSIAGVLRGQATPALGYFAQMAGAVGAYASGVFMDLRKDAMVAFAGISAALSGGQFSVAAQILWTGLQLEWLKGTNALAGIWTKFKSGFFTVFTELNYGLLDAWASVTSKFGQIWIDIVQGLKIAWAGFVAGIKIGWEDVEHLAAKALLRTQGLTPQQLADADEMEDKQHATNLDKIMGDGALSMAAINAEWQKQLDANAKAKASALSDIAKAEADALNAANKGSASEQAKAEARIKQLKDQLQSLSTGATDYLKSHGSALFTPPGLNDKFTGADDLQEAHEKVFGTFDVRNIGMMFGGGKVNKTPEIAQKILDIMVSHKANQMVYS